MGSEDDIILSDLNFGNRRIKRDIIFFLIISSYGSISVFIHFLSSLPSFSSILFTSKATVLVISDSMFGDSSETYLLLFNKMCLYTSGYFCARVSKTNKSGKHTSPLRQKAEVKSLLRTLLISRIDDNTLTISVSRRMYEKRIFSSLDN